MLSSSPKPAPRDLSHHINWVTKNRKPSFIKDFYKYFTPELANTAGGMPNNNYFPFDTLEGAAALPQRFDPSPKNASTATRVSPAAKTDVPKAQVVVPKESEQHDILREIDVKTALQYGTAQGYPPLYSFLRQFTREYLHPNVPYKDGPEIILTCGSTDGMAKTIECFTTPWNAAKDPVEERQSMICEEFAYTNALQTVAPRGLGIVPVKMDDEGMLADGPGGLGDVLENWDLSKGKRPHLIYTVTIGQNPTSGTLSIPRRKALYALCVEYDVLIIEDEPYWYMQYPSASLSTISSSHTSSVSSGYPFLDSLVPSYLSMDTDGRVIRLDTFSKTVAPGCRLGWITAQPNFIAKILQITETSTQQPSGFVQAMIAQLLMGPDAKIPPSNQHVGGKQQDGWKMDGWVRWIEGLRGAYERRMNHMCQTLDEGRFLVKSGRRPSLEATVQDLSISERKAVAEQEGIDDEDDDWRVIESTPLYSFAWPRAGMFVWLELHLASHPLAKRIELPQLARALWVFLTKPPHSILVSPGTLFSPTDEVKEKEGWKYFRLSFAPMLEEDVKPISERFVRGVRAFWKVKNLDGIEELAAKGKEVEAQGAMPGFC